MLDKNIGCAKIRNSISYYETMANESRPTNLVQTIQRVSSILEELGKNPRGISIRDLSLKLKLPKGTTHRLLSSLNYYAYVRQDPNTRNYSLGLKLVELGNVLLSQLDIRKVAEPFLKDLADRTQETIHMVILDQKEVVYIDKIEADHHIGGLRMASRIGARNPAHCCAVGKVLLSFLPDQELDLLIQEKGLRKRTENTITDPTHLKEHLKTVRKQGYAMDDEENEKGIRCVAAPILNEAGKAVAAISLSGPAFRITKKAVLETLKKEVMETAYQISRRLGLVTKR
jgi:DNA-binding IclR family transcriptional regulator